jgi:hypothetical protein
MHVMQGMHNFIGSMNIVLTADRVYGLDIFLACYVSDHRKVKKRIVPVAQTTQFFWGAELI